MVLILLWLIFCVVVVDILMGRIVIVIVVSVRVVFLYFNKNLFI